MAGIGNYRHGGQGTRLYRIWKSMRERCNTITATNYPRYGGRGIKVCSEWNDFAVFREWALSHGYSAELTLDRIDNDKGYSPDNCRWVSYLEQAQNTRSVVLIEYKGKKMSISAWGREVGIRSSLISARLKKGWSVERALTEKPYIGKNQSRRVV